VVAKQARSMVNMIWGEGQWGAHQSGRPAVAQHDGKGNSSVARMNGRRWLTSGRGVRVDHGKSFGSSCVAGGGQRVVNIGELCKEEDTVVELSSPASVAGASTYKRALDDVETMVVQTLGPNGNGVWWGWPVLERSMSGG
jgi:hypothetical protein